MIGLFIVVDGIDGSGKTEIIKMLHNYLFSKHKGYSILTTREPTYGKYGRKIRQMLRNEQNPESSANDILKLFLEDRTEHLKDTIEPFIKNSNKPDLHIVLCDRYYYSTIAFQGAQGLTMEELINKNKLFRKPDLAFILDAEPTITLERIKNRKKEKFERLNFMKKVRKNFLKLQKLLDDNIRVIDASKPLSKVFEDVKKEVDKLLC